ncbi:hypothetical protein EYR36_011565 [Pleurotus pulmonarius]|nr:hypothetical protein EYR36_011565 [Pleurotus pulmonarius]
MVCSYEIKPFDLTPLPATLPLKATPPVWRSPTLEGYPTPAYYLGWRLTCEQITQLLDPGNDTEPNMAELKYDYVLPRWEKLGYVQKFTQPNARPCMTLGPSHDGPWDQEVFVFAYSNMTKGTLAAAKSPRAAEVLEAIRLTLNLPDNTGLGKAKGVVVDNCLILPEIELTRPPNEKGPSLLEHFGSSFKTKQSSFSEVDIRTVNATVSILIGQKRPPSRHPPLDASNVAGNTYL